MSAKVSKFSRYSTRVAKGKSQPFGTQFATRLTGINGKLTCTLSCTASQENHDSSGGGGGSANFR